jgi:Spermine/spermidine synthase domain
MPDSLAPTEAAAPDTRLGGTGFQRPYLDLFLISFLILFFELACIRWFGSMVVFLTFFTNIVLMATFLGMSVGCLSASSPRDWDRKTIPLLLLAAVAARLILGLYGQLNNFIVDVGRQGSPQQIYFGTEYRARNPAAFVVPIEWLAAVFFVLIALTFVGLGQVMGRSFNKAPDRLKAYTANIGGSLAGIAAFSAASYLRTTPLAWFAVTLVVWLYFLKRWTPVQIYAQIAVLCLAAMTAYSPTPWAPYQKSRDYGILFWSPYYKIQYSPASRQINTNNLSHQQMMDVTTSGPGYSIPHLLNRNSGGKPFGNVLIIGAGSGNDVACALKHGAQHIDAIEIDPAINEVGRANHPNAPYDDPRVTVHIDDGRSFMRKTDRKYDLVIYALVDSLVLHSGYSSLRLESFLFTKEAFTDINARLAPGGMVAVYNQMRQGWLVGRIDKMMTEVFGARPMVVSLPYIGEIHPDDAQANRITFFFTGNQGSPLGAIRQRFAERHAYWLHQKAAVNDAVDGFGDQPPQVAGVKETDWEHIGPATVHVEENVRIATDDWPFPYLRHAAIPSLNVRAMILLAVVAMAILWFFSPVKNIHPNGRMFFLGAGFMLLETKGVVHLALLFGSTWIVNSVVFFAILVLILASNLFVRLVQPKALWPYYGLLVAALALNIAVPMSTFLALPGWQKVAVSCAVVFIPIFFAGIVFSTSFRDSRNPDLDFGSNVAGAVLGGLSENFSLVLGFKNLLVIAVIFYLLSAVLKPRAASLMPATH